MVSNKDDSLSNHDTILVNLLLSLNILLALCCLACKTPTSHEGLLTTPSSSLRAAKLDRPHLD